MLDRVSEVELQTFRHANVVRALAAGFGATYPAYAEVIKSKLKNFYAEGFGPPATGRGREIQYCFDDIMDWAVGITLQELGAPTKMTLSNVQRGCYNSRFKSRFAKRMATGSVYIVRYCTLIPDSTKWKNIGIPLLWEMASNEVRRDAIISFAVENDLSYAVSNFSKTRGRIIAELQRVIEEGVRP